MSTMNPISGTDLAAAEAPLHRLFLEWQALHHQEQVLYQVTEDFCGDPRCADATARLLAIEDVMLAIPAADASEWLLKFWAVTDGGVFAMDQRQHAGLWAEARELVARRTK